MPLPHSARLIAAGVALTSLWGTPPAVGAPPPSPAATPCAGATAADVIVRGCELAGCATAEDVERFTSLTDLEGRHITDGDIPRVRERLLATGLFRAVDVRCDPAEAGPDDERRVDVTLDVTPNTFVRRVRVEGNQFFRRTDVLKRVFLRAGTVLNVDPERPRDNEQVARQIASLDRFYRDAGLDDATFEVTVRPVDETTLDVVIAIEEGVRARVASIAARHEHLGEPAPGDLACPTITERRLERLIGVSLGDVVTSKLHREIRDRVRRAFQAAGYVRPRILGLDGAGDDPTHLDVTVETERCWLVRVWERETDFGDAVPAPSFRLRDPVGQPPTRGGREARYRRADLDEWREVLPFGESGVFDRGEAARAVGAMRDALRARGYPFAEVVMQHRDLSLRPEWRGRRGGTGDVRGVIDYMITRNHERRIRAITLTGREAFDAATLLGVMQTQVYDFFGAPGTFDAERFFFDLEAVRQHYRDRGFYDFRFGVRDDDGAVHGGARVTRRTPDAREPPAPEDDWVVWEHVAGDVGFLLAKRRSELGLYLEVPIREGPRTRVAALAVAGARRMSEDELREISGLAAGAPFGPIYVERAVERLTRWYRKRGFHHVRVDLTCEAHASRSGDASFCDPQQPVRADRVDVAVRIAEGPRSYVGEVFWRGLHETDPHVITRDLPPEGAPLDVEAIDAAVREMRALGLFNSVRVDLIGLDEDPPREHVAIVVAVEEMGYRFIDVAAGLRSIQRADLERVPAVVASASGNLLNLSDRATTGFGRAFPLDIPDLLLMLELEYLDLNVFGLGHQLRLPMAAGFSFSQFLRLASFNPTYVWPRLLDSDVRFEGRLIAELDRVTDPIDRLELGVELDFTLPLSRRMWMGLNLRPSVLKLSQPGEACVFCLEEGAVGFGAALPDRLASEVTRDVACAEGGELEGACDERGFEGLLRTSLRWRWDERDSPLHPTEGFELSASSTFIVGKVGVDTRAIEDAFFLKWEMSARLAIDMKVFVLALFARYGGSHSFGDVAFLPAIERYTLGGSNGLRGFADNAVCRYDADGELDPSCPGLFGGNVVLNGNVEARVPVVPSVGLWLAAFLDVGALAEDHDSVYLASFRTGAGVGVRWLVGGQLPVRLDVGFPLSRRCIARREDGEGCAVIEDANVVHLEFLYPF